MIPKQMPMLPTGGANEIDEGGEPTAQISAHLAVLSATPGIGTSFSARMPVHRIVDPMTPGIGTSFPAMMPVHWIDDLR